MAVGHLILTHHHGDHAGSAADVMERAPSAAGYAGAEDIPEIDNRTGFQMDDTGFHPAFETFAYRARLDRSNGHHDNQVIWTGPAAIAGVIVVGRAGT